MSTTEERLARLEQRFWQLEERLARMEGTKPAAQATPVRPQPPARPAPAPRERSAVQPPPRPELDLEELLGGRLLALAGGIAVIVGLAFLVALAVERGWRWLGEAARTSLAFAGSAALLGLGAWLHERRGRTQASLAACG